ncbi:hypothetical protein PFICI_01494 [Pestalotiopsis fici W106-1]|uniref:Amidohydrolase 3 domain-containing protein n=1 Tax=Pestalotiopsis fici (strain W106-1 / CGMCC3.15140) TaxID=1229662 RepID=W3XR07_PESFW|nr:uncharacterized protein PFICI_01494 [Pestalotiopsis fici W106-1]ETS87666.1 hypothetical protein PFICI_01494 [Pestalotiopsis fici W106-1]
MAKVLRNGRFFLPQSGRQQNAAFADCIVIDQNTGKILQVGSAEDASIAAAIRAGADQRDMQGRVVVPGFVDAHMHLLMTGEAMSKLDIGACTSLADIQATIRAYAAANPSLPRLLCRNWWQSSTNGEALAVQLDDVDPRPIYIDANDLHSVWCNTAALEELRLEKLPDPPGGRIHRYDDGKPSGLLSEGAVISLVWPFLNKSHSLESKLAYLDTAFEAYISAGYTSVGELAMDESMWQLLSQYEARKGSLPLFVTAYWLITPQESLADALKQVDRAIELFTKPGHDQQDGGRRRIGGIKIICDGVVDSCTAALREPYSHDNSNVEPMWTVESLAVVLKHADAAGLQCALHAIGDEAIKTALDALELVGNPSGRHRIEHLELCSPEDAQRLGPLGVIASIQPVHSDPAGLTAWPKLIGAGRCRHIFPYASFANFGAILAMGSDCPTAPHNPLANMYVATNRRSARKPELEDKVAPEFALKLADAVTAATMGAAHACFTDGRTGRLEAGYMADLAVVDMDWDPQMLLKATVVETWSRGQRIFGKS